MQQHAAVVAESPDLGQRLDHADLVVGQHDGDKDRVVAEGLGHAVDHQARPAGRRAGTTGSRVTSNP